MWWHLLSTAWAQPAQPPTSPWGAEPPQEEISPVVEQSAQPSPVVVRGETITELDTPPLGLVDGGEQVWLLTSDHTLQTWVRGEEQETPSWSLADEQPVPGAVGLMQGADQTWMIVQQTRAIPIGGATDGLPLAAVAAPHDTATPPAEPEPEPESEPEPEPPGSVIRSDLGTAVVDLGRADGLLSGSEIEILGTVFVTVPSLDGEGSETREVEQVVATGRVRVLEEDRALVDLSRGGRVEAEDRVEAREGIHRYPLAPARLGGLREVGGVLRPLLALDTVGLAFLNEAWFTWLPDGPWYGTARVAPLGLGWSQDGNPLVIAGLISGGYDSPYFSVGLGTGWSMLNGKPGSTSYDLAAQESDGGLSAITDFEDVDNALAVAQEARLGARDGLHMVIRNTFLLTPTWTYTYDEACSEEDYDGDYSDCYIQEKDSSEFVYGGFAMRVAVPTGDRSDLVLDWATGAAGATWVTGGVAAWLRGNGDKGSLGLEVAAGYGMIEASPNDENVELYGPLVSLGARHRW
ncbi:MAG: hypothetical protein QGG40_14815 [Myxococcota bacterium]|nr:hypothetical protein [Myxococcota bacterium]